MQQAWSDLARTHPALRMAIVADPSGHPMQVVQPAEPIIPTLHDWSDLDPQQIARHLRDFLAADRDAGVDATCNPPFRINIFHTGTAQSKLVFTFPHSLLDGRSFAPLIDDVFQRYLQILSGTAAPLPPIDGPGIFETHCRALAKMSHRHCEKQPEPLDLSIDCITPTRP